MRIEIPGQGPAIYRVVRFACCGGFSTAMHWATMALLIQTGVSAIWATTAGAVTGAAINYGLQRRVTFRSDAPHGRALWLYLNACAASWLANLGVFAVLHHLLGLDVIPAQVVTTALVTGMNYLLYERLVFND
ncbi:hypothetical protein RE428_33000 [Marinobacter nanhaiticus D15-8W]|uniref:GtrA family protein n=1 Tax=Marinobacter nanhaiticus D15-8W TaxID=626887 RepID=N6X5W4_9GAMM|nr:GtrA family protein [Marinobacter nanhaiticus]ENO16493.1 GtrA family protein [Marinobacter nanhaiticus D15-8W]BES72282.1 hypothetical protein RE428_33000 [Marinobacter nanhaiticus D15-8W]